MCLCKFQDSLPRQINLTVFQRKITCFKLLYFQMQLLKVLRLLVSQNKQWGNTQGRHCHQVSITGSEGLFPFCMSCPSKPSSRNHYANLVFKVEMFFLERSTFLYMKLREGKFEFRRF